MRDAGIPTSQTHRTHTRGDAAKSGNSGRRGIEYEFDVKGPYETPQTKYVQDHFEGHVFKDGTIDNTPHFNIHQRPKNMRNNTENNHYPYTPKKNK